MSKPKKQPKNPKRPGLGGGLAEEAAKLKEERGRKIDDILEEMISGKKKKKKK